MQAPPAGGTRVGSVTGFTPCARRPHGTRAMRPRRERRSGLAASGHRFQDVSSSRRGHPNVCRGDRSWSRGGKGGRGRARAEAASAAGARGGGVKVRKWTGPLGRAIDPLAGQARTREDLGLPRLRLPLLRGLPRTFPKRHVLAFAAPTVLAQRGVARSGGKPAGEVSGHQTWLRVRWPQEGSRHVPRPLHRGSHQNQEEPAEHPPAIMLPRKPLHRLILSRLFGLRGPLRHPYRRASP